MCRRQRGRRNEYGPVDRRREDGPDGRSNHGWSGVYFSIAIPLFVVACMLRVPFVGVLAVLTFWLVPTTLRVVRRPAPVPQQLKAPEPLPVAAPRVAREQQEESLYAGTEYPRD